MKHSICMVCDYFYPKVGGVESHIFQLSQCLLQLGHKVIVITHSYGDRTGIRYMTNGLKVYYTPFATISRDNVLPSCFNTLPLLRYIFIREQITIVHGHSSFSTLCCEAQLHAVTMGIRTVMTDHSLGGFADISSLLTNKLLSLSLAQVYHVICVSHTSKENTVLRSGVCPSKVSVIPNAIDPCVFKPLSQKTRRNKVTVVVLSRLVYRKGTDFLATIIPRICSKYDNVDFLIGGDGDKRIVVEQVREEFKLQDRVKLLGSVNHSQARDILTSGEIFLNMSLTEAFCIAIVEAASCGLQIVSTNVGGIPEVLPPHLIHLAQPTSDSLIEKLCLAIDAQLCGNVRDPHEIHNEVKHLYLWPEVAQRTEKIYNMVSDVPIKPYPGRLKGYKICGTLHYFLFALLSSINLLFLSVLEWCVPTSEIELASDWKK